MTAGSRSAPPKSMPFPPGTILDGKYCVERLLGEGGMGWVVVATHLKLEQRVAVKFMHASSARDTSDAVPRFLREARAAARIQSEHVARVSDYGTLENGAPYLVMEYLQGQDLESLLRTRGALPTELVVDYAMQACEGLAEAHAAGIVHRDLKPANLFLARRTDGSVRVKLLDFGISKLATADGVREVAMTSTQALMGSPLYMAPEQMRSSKNVDARADIWSMGVILYEMLAGRPPFDGETLPVVCTRIMTEPPPGLRTLKPNVPVALEGVVMRCLEKEPERRFPDVAALARALATFGVPQAHISAERIGRVHRASAFSLPEITTGTIQAGLDDSMGEGVGSAPAAAGHGRPLELGEEPQRPANASARGIVQTRAEFSHTGPASSARRGARALAMGGGALFVIAAIGIAVLATRGRTPVPASAAAMTATPATAGSAETLAPITMPAPASTPSATPTTTAADTAAPALRASARPTAPAFPPQPRVPPHAKPAMSTKPPGTAAFGGRD